MQVLEKSLNKLQNYIEAQDYSGWDPYDILKSPFFKMPFVNRNKPIRFYSQQFGKRFPINIRPLLFVPKGCNPVTLGLCIQAYSYLIIVYPGKRDELEKKIFDLIIKLKKLIPSGFNGACWGYDFDWEARYTSIPGYQPNIVATGIITNALFEFFRTTGNTDALDLCKSACGFVLKDLNRTGSPNSFCFSYSPFDHQLVFNASMKGVRLLGQVYSITKDEALLNQAKRAIDYVVKHQNTDGSWYYSLASKGTWVDNYHTGYILDCMDEYNKCTKDAQYKASLQKGYEYYLNYLFEDDFKPKFYNHALYPLDCTASAQSLLTLVRFGDIQKANNVAEYTIGQMQNREGYFYFRKHKNYTQKTSYMRWSNGWMFAALAFLISSGRK
jgi:rhamnogalacturonyl hydrolase YesR